MLTGGEEVPFWGAFQTLDRVLELEPQESVTHHPSTSEVAPVPRTRKHPSSAGPPKLNRSVLLGEREKEKRGLVRQPQVCQGAGGRAPLCSPGRDTLFRTLCAGTPQVSAETWTPAGLGIPLPEGRGCVSAHART